MPLRAAACAAVLATVLAFGAQPSARPAAGAVRWAWSGGVTARSATVKARVSRAGIPVRLTLVRAGAGLASPETHEATADPHGIASFDLQALAPATRYGYEVTADGAAPLAGAFRTFGEGPCSFRIAFSACAETGSASSVFDAIGKAAPDLFIHNGDIHYEDITRNEPERFRRAFDAVMASPTQSRLYRSVPIAYTWDDDDFGGNGSDASSAADARGFTRRSASAGCASSSPTRDPSAPRARAPQARSMLGAAQLRWLKDELSARRS